MSGTAPNPMRGVRWFAIVPAAILTWYVVLILGIQLTALAATFCPPEAMISQFCAATWFADVQRTIIVLCAGLAGFGIVYVAASVAPAERVLVAWAIFFASALVAVVMVLETRAVAEFTTAITGGLAAIYATRRFLT
jgi:hypothetical protein